MTNAEKLTLKKHACHIRMGVIEGTHSAGCGHPGGSLSIADVLSYLYFKELNIDPAQPRMADRDRLVLSKGHAAPALYAALAERFSPRLVREASEIFSELTGGRYARVQISRQMELEAGQPDAAMRRSLFLSGGTADELYLSVRLAVCRLLLPEDAPLLLDDALVMFDDDRLRLALRLLQREAENRQILLFTCQHREQKALTTDL